MIDNKLLTILACPVCKGELVYKQELDEFWCRVDGLAFPVKDDIPVMLEDQARSLTSDEKLSRK
ncbi:MAG: Trm112 family protein [Gammaproteobacteria bacterium]|nr:Trm112 family protein [Gammaproteobacteria bacterium]